MCALKVKTTENKTMWRCCGDFRTRKCNNKWATKWHFLTRGISCSQMQVFNPSKWPAAWCSLTLCLYCIYCIMYIVAFIWWKTGSKQTGNNYFPILYTQIIWVRNNTVYNCPSAVCCNSNMIYPRNFYREKFCPLSRTENT